MRMRWGKRSIESIGCLTKRRTSEAHGPKKREREKKKTQNAAYLKVPSSQIGVFGDVFHVYLRMRDAHRARLRRCMGVVGERRWACHKRNDVRRAPVCRE